MALHATYFGANGWLLEFGDLKVLVDPWLRGELEFPPGPWLFRGSLPRDWPVPTGLDLLLLTQGLPDHCHPPTLSLLERDLPIVGSPAAARRVRQLGFSHVVGLEPGEALSRGALRITATAGAPVPQVENGYLLEHPEGRLYLEPHGFLPPDLQGGPLDAVITPVVDLGLPVAGAFVKGREVLPLLLQRFRPATVLASTAGGDLRFSGLLPRILWQKGSAIEARRLVEGDPEPPGGEDGSPRFIDPVPGERYALATAARVGSTT
jgi:hypothetical protein